MNLRTAPPEPLGASARITATTPEFLLFSADPVIQQACAKAAAAAGVELQLAQHGARMPNGAEVTRAQVLLVGTDVEDLPRSQDVAVLIGHGASREQLWDKAIRIGAQRVAEVPEGTAWLAEYMGSQGRSAAHARVHACCGSAGGLGATTLAARLAVEAAHSGLSVLFVNLDAQGPPPQLMMAAEPGPGIGWPELNASAHSLAPEHLAAALPALGGFSFLGWPASSSSPGSTGHEYRVIEAAREAFELIVLDVPRPALAPVSWLCDQVTLLSSLALADLVSESRLASSLSGPAVQLLLRARRREIGDAANVAERLGLDFAGVLHHERGLPGAASAGTLLAQRPARHTRRILRELLNTAMGAQP